MLVRFKQADKRTAANAFTLVEVLMSLSHPGDGGIGADLWIRAPEPPMEANRIAEWSSMSLAAQSYASQGPARL
jgi:hypothetical protein